MFDEPLPQADSHTLQMCIAQCDVLMQRNEQRRGITAIVRSKLFRESGGFPSLPEVAAELDVHPRTLRRQLADEGTSFRALLNEARSSLGGRPVVQRRAHRRGSVEAVGLHRHIDVLPRLQTVARGAAERVSALTPHSGQLLLRITSTKSSRTNVGS